MSDIYYDPCAKHSTQQGKGWPWDNLFKITFDHMGFCELPGAWNYHLVVQYKRQAFGTESWLNTLLSVKTVITSQTFLKSVRI